MIKYQVENNLKVEEFRDVLVKSTLGERRPIDDRETMELMVANAGIIVTGRLNGKLVGVARTISDFVYCSYLSDLAVDLDFQKMGIGKELIRQTKLAIPKGKLILLSAPAAVNYYPKIGMTKHEHCFYMDGAEELS